MYIANLGTTYYDVVNMIEVAKAVREGRDDPSTLDDWIAGGESAPTKANRVRVIRAVFPEYKFLREVGAAE